MFIGWLEKFKARRKANEQFLRRVANEVGKEVENWDFDQLSRPAEEISFSRVIDGVTVSFSLEAYESNDRSDLHICIDVRADLSVFPFMLPSYVFWKRPDGTVYYG